MSRKTPSNGDEYFICVEAVITLHTTVVATSLEAAIQEATSRSVMTLCHECSRGEPDTEWVTSGELDCDPSDCVLSEVVCNGEDITDAAKACWEMGR